MYSMKQMYSNTVKTLSGLAAAGGLTVLTACTTPQGPVPEVSAEYENVTQGLSQPMSKTLNLTLVLENHGEVPVRFTYARLHNVCQDAGVGIPKSWPVLPGEEKKLPGRSLRYRENEDNLQLVLEGTSPNGDVEARVTAAIRGGVYVGSWNPDDPEEVEEAIRNYGRLECK